MTDSGPDPTIRELRQEISEVDRTIVAAVNARLELVARLKRYKEEHGFAFLDPNRERALIEELVRTNPGPLTAEGVRELSTSLLELTKRHVQ
ncbi:MAG: chorismate mutase [Actinobacteria bacterium]|nr:chorismate mutase [Actinomycetota bacterium]